MFATLRRPFFGFGDESLLSFRHQLGGDGAVKIAVSIRYDRPTRAALDHRGGHRGVRVMTVHKSKAWNSPSWCLPTPPGTRSAELRAAMSSRIRLWTEPLCNSAPVELLEAAEEELWRDREEAVRVMYVATTRARDLLVAPVCGDAASPTAGRRPCRPPGDRTGRACTGRCRMAPRWCGGIRRGWAGSRRAHRAAARTHTGEGHGRAATASAESYLAWEERRAALLGGHPGLDGLIFC